MCNELASDGDGEPGLGGEMQGSEWCKVDCRRAAVGRAVVAVPVAMGLARQAESKRAAS